MAIPPREMSVAYGAKTFGTTTNLQIHDRLVIEKTWDRFAVEFQALVSGTTDAEFAAECTAVETAIRTPSQNLVVKFGGQEHQNLKSSEMRGLAAVGRVLKSRELLGTRRARIYDIRIEGELPADQASLLGRRKTTVAVTWSPGRRRTVVIAGEWTALPTTATARANYDTNVGAYATSVLTALSGNFELADESMDIDDLDLSNIGGGTVLRFRRVYDELIFAQIGAASANNSTSLVRQNLEISRQRIGPGDSPGARRLETFNVTYRAWVDQAVTAPSIANYRALWDDTIRPAILTEIRGMATGNIIVVESEPRFILDETQISATITVQARGGSNIIERQVTMEDHDVGGFIAVPVWDGNKRSRYRFDAPLRRQRVIIENAVVIQDLSPLADPTTSMGAGVIGSLGGEVIEKHSTVTPLILGRTDSGGEIRAVRISGRMVVEVFDETRGDRLAAGLGDNGAKPFGFNFDQGVFDQRATAGIGVQIGPGIR